MIDRSQLLRALEGVSQYELARFRGFLATHSTSEIVVEGTPVSYCVCGCGDTTILTFAGGWGGIEIVYETILGFEDHNRMVVIDITPFDNPSSMCTAVNLVLDHEGIGHVVVMGQSLSGILGQLYFRRSADRVQGLVLTNTLAPRPERCRRWPLLLMSCLPLGFLRLLMRRKMACLERFEQELPPEVEGRRRFARALLLQELERSFTRHRIGRILRLCWSFNEEGGYRADELSAWTGGVLLVTSQDDPYYRDAEILGSSLPAAELYSLPVGFGHTAPQICREQYQAAIQGFIDLLGSSSVKASNTA